MNVEASKKRLAQTPHQEGGVETGPQDGRVQDEEGKDEREEVERGGDTILRMVDAGHEGDPHPESSPEEVLGAISQFGERSGEDQDEPRSGKSAPVVSHTSVDLTRYTCSAEFRAQVFASYPALAENLSYRRFMSHLLFTERRDNETGYVLIPAPLIAEAEGKMHEQRQKKYRSETFLEQFRDNVLPEFEWTGHGRNFVRRVRRLGVSPEVLEALERELSRCLTEERVYFDTGEPTRDKDRNAEREKARAGAVERCRGIGVEGVRRVAHYLNGRPPNTFTGAVRRHLPEAFRHAQCIEDVEKRLAALRTLRTIQDQPQPFYAPSAKQRTVRLFCPFDSLLNLQKEVRRVLTQDWAEFDLRNSQLAICSVQWGVQEVQVELQRGGSIWKPLLTHLGIDPYGEAAGEVKPHLKKALYSALFGMREGNVKGQLQRGLRSLPPHLKAFAPALADDMTPTRFLQHPVIAAMLDARGRRMKQIREDGGAENHFGEWVLYNEDEGEKSVLAQLAQATEMALLLPAIDLAVTEGTKAFQILLWQHDGFSVTFRNQTKRDRWVRRITEAVNAEANRLGIPTELEVDKGPAEEVYWTRRLAA